MRLLEFVVLLLDFFIIWLLPRWPVRRLGLLVLPLLLQWLVEGYRWQLGPLYLLTLALIGLAVWRTLRPGQSRLIWSIIATFLVLLAAIPPIAFPVPRLLQPTGPYAIGTTTIYLNDESRPESYTTNPTDTRELMLQVWYPADPAGTGQPAPYLDHLDLAGRAIAQRLNLPSFLLNHLELVKTHSQIDVPMAKDGPFPLLIFVHGLRGIRQQNSMLMEDLASHGYIVASADHPYANVLTIFPDGRAVFYDEAMVFPAGLSQTEAGRQLVQVWAADVRFVLDQFTVWHGAESGLFSGRVALDQIGVLGHSTGGGTALESCGQDGRCQAALALDGWIQPVSAEILASGLSRPVMFISSSEWLGPDNAAKGMALYQQTTAASYLLTIPGTAHFDYSDLPQLSPLMQTIGLAGSLPGREVIAMINRYTLAFFDTYLKNQPSPLLDQSIYPELILEKRPQP